MAAATASPDYLEDEFLNSWFPSLDTGSFIIPTTNLRHVHALEQTIGDQTVSVLLHPSHPSKPCGPDTRHIDDLDLLHQNIHACLGGIREQVAPRDVMVIMTQTRFGMYDNLLSSLAACAAGKAGRTRDKQLKLAEIARHMGKHSDLVVVHKQRGGVLVGMVQRVHLSDPTLAG